MDIVWGGGLSDIWRTDRGVAEVRSPGIRSATEDDIRQNAPGLVEETHLKTLHGL